MKSVGAPFYAEKQQFSPIITKDSILKCFIVSSRHGNYFLFAQGAFCYAPKLCNSPPREHSSDKALTGCHTAVPELLVFMFSALEQSSGFTVCCQYNLQKLSLKINLIRAG